MGVPPDLDRVRCGPDVIAYSVVRSRRRSTACITVHQDGDVKLSVPYRMSCEQARRFIREKSGWILKKRRDFELAGCRDVSKKYVEGEPFLYRGREYSLRVSAGAGPIVTLGDRHLNVIVPSEVEGEARAKAIRQAVYGWYKLRAEMAIGEALTELSGRSRVPVPPYKVKNQSKRWGSCTAKGLLNFNVKIVMAPPEQIEYLVAHELCHVKIKDHSPRYWSCLRSLMPNYESAKKALKNDGWKYEL